jgi:phage anti-repressor protein
MNNNIIPVFSGTITGIPTQLVNARELHTFLENKDMFAHWIKDRLTQYDFVENQDFISFWENSQKPQGGRPNKEYHITLDMAKELSMVERNEKGKQARRYFIDCEKVLHNDPLIALLYPSNPVMTASEMYIWHAKLKEELIASITKTVDSITLVATDDDNLHLPLSKSPRITSYVVHSTEGGAE